MLIQPHDVVMVCSTLSGQNDLDQCRTMFYIRAIWHKNQGLTASHFFDEFSGEPDDGK